MPGRIAKPALMAVIAEAKDRLLAEAGPDGIVSRADKDRAVAKAPSEKEGALAAVFFGFTDHRDFKSGARVTKPDLERAFEYAGPKMVDRLDVNNNGLSKAEIAKSESSTVKLAAAILSERLRAKAAAAE